MTQTDPDLEPARFAARPDPRPADTPWPQLVWPVAPGTLLSGTTVALEPTRPSEDAAELFAALDDDRVWEHVAGRPGTVQDYAAQLAAATDGRLRWTVRLVHAYCGLPAGSVVGTSSYLDVSVADARLEIGSTSYRPAVWGTSVNPETKLLLLSFAFEQLHAGRVQLKTDIRNVRSQQAIARLGAQYEGTLRRYQRRSDGTARDTVMFSIVAEQWPEVRDRLRRRIAQG